MNVTFDCEFFTYVHASEICDGPHEIVIHDELTHIER